MNNHYSLEKVARARQEELLETARLERLLRQSEVKKPGLWKGLTRNAGELMVRLGSRLKADKGPRLEQRALQLAERG